MIPRARQSTATPARSRQRNARRADATGKIPQRPVDASVKPLKRIAIINHKGGVGKTSTAVHLAGGLASFGYRVLLVDCDSQGDLSAIFTVGSQPSRFTVANLLDGSVFAEDAIQKTAFENIDLIAADERLNALDQTHGFESSPNVRSLADSLAAIQDRYDYLIFDCPPRPHLSAFAALVAASDVLIPTEPSQFSVRSMVRLLQEIDLARTTHNPELAIRGYFLSKVSRASSQKQYGELMVEAFADCPRLTTRIPMLATLETAINLKKPVVFHKPQSAAADVFRRFALEVISPKHP